MLHDHNKEEVLLHMLQRILSHNFFARPYSDTGSPQNIQNGVYLWQVQNGGKLVLLLDFDVSDVQSVFW